jgi:hypothetical protein
VSGYFDTLADILPPGALDTVGKALDAYNREGAGRRDEPALLHGVRTLIELVRADERVTAEAAAELKHQRTKALYEQYTADNKAATERVRRRLTKDVEHALGAYKAVHDMALTARARGRKTLPAADVIEAVGLDDWAHSEREVAP